MKASEKGRGFFFFKEVGGGGRGDNFFKEVCWGWGGRK